VEFGTSFGISTLHLAAAVRDNGTGRVITTELSAAKARAACTRESRRSRLVFHALS
jgi:predicted O-methyltransferase YrrM